VKPKGAKDDDTGSLAVVDTMPGGLLKGVKDAIEPLCMSGKCCCCCLLLHYTGLIRVFCNVSQANVAQSTP
jgi:hypothetical protein